MITPHVGPRLSSTEDILKVVRLDRNAATRARTDLYPPGPRTDEASRQDFTACNSSVFKTGFINLTSLAVSPLPWTVASLAYPDMKMTGRFS